MKKAAMLMGALASVALFAPAAFAQEAGAVSGKGTLAIAAAFGMALAAFAALWAEQSGGVGLRRHGAESGSFCRDPGTRHMILGLVFIETLALFTLAIIFAKV